jgi:hypothetical protein
MGVSGMDGKGSRSLRAIVAKSGVEGKTARGGLTHVNAGGGQWTHNSCHAEKVRVEFPASQRG